MRSAAVAFATVLIAGVVALAAVALTTRTTLVYTLGVKPALVAAELAPGQRVCQAPIRLPRDARFDRVGFLLGTFGRPGPEVEVEARRHGDGARLARGRLAGGYADLGEDRAEHVVRVGEVRTDAPLSICLTNRGRRLVAVIGQAGVASPPTSATIEGEPIPSDITLNLHDEGRSLAARLPDIAERASRFRAGWVTPAVYLVLVLAIVIAGPLLLARGVARAADADGQRRPST